jgi:anion-transporting  ArsA/GET3 family ATPase
VADGAQSLLDRRFQVVVGKGGVGRTLVASAIALRSARSGRRTLLLEVNAPDNCATTLGVAPAVDVPREVMSELYLCRMTPEGAMREYALLVLKFKALYTLVFENRLVKYLLRSIPSLGEFTMLGKAWYHAEERLPDGSLKYERVIIDAPATGHAITFLSVARTVADITPPGVMKDAAEKMAQLVESKDYSALHVVTLPEEMPVNEGLEMLAAGRGKLRMTAGVGFVNRRLQALVSSAEATTIDALDPTAPGLGPYLQAVAGRRARERFQGAHEQRFREASGLPVLTIPELGPGPPALEEVVQILGGSKP